MNEDLGVVHIESTRNVPDGSPNGCRLRWGGRHWLASTKDVRQTAEDLFTCAAYSDLIGELLRVGLDGAHILALMEQITKKRMPRYFGTPNTLFLNPAGSSKRQQGMVLLARRDLFHLGKADGMLTPDEAREMGRVWIEAAESSDSDTLFDQVLRRAGWLDGAELDAVFGYLADIRSGNDDAPPAAAQV